MQSERIDNISNISLSDLNGTDSKSDLSTFSKKKRKRAPDSDLWSKKEEDKILQYALKLSEKEFKKQKQKSEDNERVNSYERIPECNVFQANEEDLTNFIAFVERSMGEKGCTGILKIVPSAKWVERNREFFGKNVIERIKGSTKKLYTRKQILSQLYQAKVII
jgi:hypothetical protein